MPEGDTIYRIAAVMRRTLRHDQIVAARGRPGGAQLERIVGSHVERVSPRGKHLLIDLSNGLTLHTHLQMHGTWHRYRPGERWRRDAAGAVAVIETAAATVVCFDAPTVELLETRALPLHPWLAQLGPDLLDPAADLGEAMARIRAQPSAMRSIAEVLLDQRLVAGIGNVYRSEVLFSVGVDPFLRVDGLADATLAELLRTARGLLAANLGGGERVTMPDALGAPPGATSLPRRDGGLWVYGRIGRPCRRCGAAIRAKPIGSPPRRLYWCPRCQAARAGQQPRVIN